MMKTKKIYEVPAFYVTELTTEDIMAESDLLGWELIKDGEILGHEMIEIDFN